VKPLQIDDIREALAEAARTAAPEPPEDSRWRSST